MADHHAAGTIDWDPINSYEKLLYALMGTSAIVSAAAFFGGKYFLSGSSLAIGVGGGLSLLQNQHSVPTSPRHVGVMTWWGKRSTSRLLPPGDYFIWKGFPFQMDITNVSMEPRTKDFRVEVPTVLKDSSSPNSGAKPAPRSGGNVAVNVQLVFVPNSNPVEMFQYLDMGGPLTAEADPKGGLINNLQGKIAEIVRTTVSRLSWNEAQFKKSELTALLLKRITGEKIHKYKRNADAIAINARGAETFDPTEYQSIGEWTAKEMMEGCSESEKLAFDVAVYLDLVNDPENDSPDVHGLGIVVKRLNVEKVELLGKLAEDAEGAAREQAQRQTRTVEMEGRLALAQTMVAASKANSEADPLTLEKAMLILRVEDDKAGEKISRIIVQGVDFSPLANVDPAVVAGIARLIPQPGNNQDEKKGKK